MMMTFKMKGTFGSRDDARAKKTKQKKASNIRSLFDKQLFFTSHLLCDRLRSILEAYRFFKENEKKKVTLDLI